jgi:NADH-ubiquinone oxidoreductase chain 4L
MKKIFLFSWSFKRKFLFSIYKTDIFIKLLKLMLIILKWFFVIYLFFIGVIAFVSTRKHLLSTLLRLEFIVLSLFFFLFLFLNLLNFELYFSILFLTFRVCEGALGVSILVSIIRTHGNDFFNSFSLLQC